MSQLEFRQKAMSAGMIVLFFVGWELFCVMTHMSDLVLPRPSQIFVTLVQKFPILWPHILQTLAATMTGFVLGNKFCQSQLSSLMMPVWAPP